MPDLSVNVEQQGVPLGTLVLGAAGKEVAFTCVNRLNAGIQALAFDVTGLAVAFNYSNTLGGTYIRVPAGAGINLPVAGTQSWFFKQDTSLAPTLQLTCAE